MSDDARPPERQGIAFWLKLLAPVTVSIGILVALRLFGPELLNQRELSAFLRPLGHWAPLAFIGMLALRPLTLLPGHLFAAVAGALFGTVAGTVYALVGSLLSSAIVFLVSRRFGRAPMRKLAGDKHEVLQHVARKEGFTFGVLACINVLVPADVMLAVAAASGARFWPTALGALIGTVPGTLLTTSFGSALSQGRTLTTVLSAAGIVASLVLGVVIGRRLMRTAERHPSVQRASKVAAPALTPAARPGVTPGIG